MAVASSTEVPPNFMTTYSKPWLDASLLASDGSFILAPFGSSRLMSMLGTNKKPTGHLFLAVGLVSCEALCFSADQAPSPRKQANSCRCACAHRGNSLSLLGSCFHGCRFAA